MLGLILANAMAGGEHLATAPYNLCVQCVCMFCVSAQIQIRPNWPASRGFDYYCEMKQYRRYCLWKLAKWPLYLTAAFADDKD